MFDFTHYFFINENNIIEKFNSIMIFSNHFNDDDNHFKNDDDDDDDDDDEQAKRMLMLIVNGVTQLMNWNILMFPKQHYYDVKFLVVKKH